jgi:hypothetical protein
MTEPFVSVEVAAAHLAISTRRLLDLARAGDFPSYPLALGRKRHEWRFRLSELDQTMASRSLAAPNTNEPFCSSVVRPGNARSRSQRP